MPHPAPQGPEPSGCDRHYPRPEPGLPDYCYHESRQLCRIQPQRGASPRDSSRHYPRPEPGLPDYCQHESMKPCRIPPHRGASHRDSSRHYPRPEPGLLNYLPARIHATMPHPAPQVREPSGNMDRCPAHLALFSTIRHQCGFAIQYIKLMS